jgi:hypothetical protein
MSEYQGTKKVDSVSIGGKHFKFAKITVGSTLSIDPELSKFMDTISPGIASNPKNRKLWERFCALALVKNGLWKYANRFPKELIPETMDIEEFFELVQSFFVYYGEKQTALKERMKSLGISPLSSTK